MKDDALYGDLMRHAPTKLPPRMGPIHFVGIGGIGMSGIAEVLLEHGYAVQGSDLRASPITERLGALGARVMVGQDAANLDGAEVVVVSSAIRPGNAELDEARLRGLPVVRRAEMLAELMRLKSNVAIGGTHGKTTTTTMVATLLDAGGLDPTVVNGGVIHAYGSNARAGRGEWMVVEADESDGTFTRLPATIAVVTNIDPEHMEHWRDMESLRAGFDQFVSNVPFYGLAVCCTDHPEVQALVGRVTDRRIVTFGFNAQADVRAVNLCYDAGTRLLRRPPPVRGDDDRGLPAAHAGGPQRLERAGGDRRGAPSRAGPGHHPRGARGVRGRQPPLHQGRRAPGHHGDRRLRPPPGRDRLGAARRAPRPARGGSSRCTSPTATPGSRGSSRSSAARSTTPTWWAIMDVYAAGEEPIEGASRDDLVRGLIRHGHRHARAVVSEDDLERLVREQARTGDMVVLLGAGSITAWAHALPGRLESDAKAADESAAAGTNAGAA